MIVRPVEMQGMVQRSQDMSQIKQNEDIKGFVDQSNILGAEQKKSEIKHETVVKHENADKKQDKYDAKEKGSNEYNQNNGHHNKQNNDEGKVILKSIANFDVKI